MSTGPLGPYLYLDTWVSTTTTTTTTNTTTTTPTTNTTANTTANTTTAARSRVLARRDVQAIANSRVRSVFGYRVLRVILPLLQPSSSYLRASHNALLSHCSRDKELFFT